MQTLKVLAKQCLAHHFIRSNWNIVDFLDDQYHHYVNIHSCFIGFFLILIIRFFFRFFILILPHHGTGHALKRNTVLKELWLAYNDLTYHDAYNIGLLLKSNYYIQILDVSNNFLQVNN